MIRLFTEAGVIPLTAFISPFQRDREFVRQLVTPADFIEIYCQCDLEICERRDVKGLYKKARTGEIPDFTGISSPYEEPENADLVLDTGHTSLESCAERVLVLLAEKGVIPNQ
jgi:adenylylsulfate kinase